MQNMPKITRCTELEHDAHLLQAGLLWQVDLFCKTKQPFDFFQIQKLSKYSGSSRHV